MAFLDRLKKLYGTVTDKVSGLFGSHTIEIINESEEDRKRRAYPSDVPIVGNAFVDSSARGQDPVKFAKSQTLPKRINNPGALEFAQQPDAKPDISGRFAEFPDYAAGRKALEADLNVKFSGKSKTGLTPDSTIREFVQKYAPDNENDVDFYTEMLTDKLGARPDSKLKDLQSRVGDFADVIEVVEGYRTPKEYQTKLDTERKQQLADPTNPEFRGMTEETIRNFFSLDVTKDTLKKFVVPALQSIPRSVLTVALSASEKLGVLPKGTAIVPGEEFGPLGEKLVGREPIRPIADTGRDFLKGFGVGDDGAKKYGLPVGLALTAADLFPSLKGGKSLALLAKLDDVAEIMKVLKGESGLADDLLKPVAEQIAKLTDVKQIEEVLAKNAVELVKTGKMAASGLVQKFSTLKDSFKQGVRNALRRDEYARAFEEFSTAPPLTSKPTGFFGKLKNALMPLKSTDKETQSIFTTWSRKISRAKQLADESIRDLPNVPSKEGLDIINKYEAGQATPFNDALKETFDALLKEGNDRGLNIPYRQNYLPHIYDNTREEVMQATAKFLKANGVDDATIKGYLEGVKQLPKEVSTRLGINPFFQEERVFNTYAEAAQYGLKPKYTNPVQLVAHYKNQLEKTIANRELLDALVAQGKILPVEIAPRAWKAVEFPFSPKGYFADPKTADMINGIFRDEDNIGLGASIARFVAQVSKKGQEVALSAGIPGTQVNFFSIGQLVKEMTSGNFKAIAPFLRANFNTRSINFFKDNQQVMKRMADNGVDLGSTIASYTKVFDTLKGQKGLWAKLGYTFDKAFNEKIFGSFMPQLYIQTFKDAELKFLKKGLQSDEAAKLAADVVRAAHGLMDFTGRGKLTEDVLSSVFFAPKFREGIINTLFNTARSVTSEIANPAFYKNRRLLGGMALSYGLYNALNYKLNGQFMWQNEKGKEFDLRVPLPNGDVAYVGFMPSFLAFARNMASGTIALGKGDFDTATQKFGSLFSIPLKLTSEIWANKDYFGREIYDPEEAGFDKLKDIASYVGLQVNHPFIREIGRQLFSDKPAYQSISEAMELPIKFKTKDQLEQGQYYDAIDRHRDVQKKAKEKIRPTYDKVQQLLEEGQEEEAQKIVDALPDEDYEVYKDIKQAEKTKATNKLKLSVYPIYQKAQELKADGKQDEANELVDSLTEEEYRVYKLIKEQGL